MNIPMKRKSGELIVSEEVIAKIAGVAAKDVTGVAGLVAKPSDLKAMMNQDRSARAVRISSAEGAMTLTVYVSLGAGVRIPEVCDQIQKNVKNAVQNMTGRPVAKVNVVVDDIDLSGDEPTAAQAQ